MEKEREKSEEERLAELGIKPVEEGAPIPEEIKTFLEKVETEPENGGEEQSQPAPALARKSGAGPLPGVIPVASGPKQVSLAAFSPRRVHNLLHHHVSQAARWLGEQVKRIIKIRLRRAGAGETPI